MNKMLKNNTIDSRYRVSLVHGDITSEESNVIINAANSYLMHGGGVAGAIVKRGGRVIQDESNKLAPIPVGSSVYTSAGKLKADYIVHTVGPKWGDGDEIKTLSQAINSALSLSDELGAKTVSLPAVSTGIFSFPIEIASDIIITEVKRFFTLYQPQYLKEIRICLLDEKVLRAFLRIWDATFSLAEIS